MVVSTVHVLNMRYVVGRNRQAATGNCLVSARQLIITLAHLLINFVHLFLNISFCGKYFPDIPDQDAAAANPRVAAANRHRII